MFFCLCPPCKNCNRCSVSTQRKSILLQRQYFCAFAVICSLLQIFATNQTFNATHAKITYLCNRFGLLGQRFGGTLQNLCFFLLCFIPLLFIVGIRYDEATLQPLIRGVLHLPFFVVAFLLFALHALLQCSVLFKPPLQVYNFTLRRFRVFLLHCCRLYWRRSVACFHCVYYYVLFLIAMQRYKHIWKRANIFPKIFVYLTFYNK